MLLCHIRWYSGDQEDGPHLSPDVAASSHRLWLLEQAHHAVPAEAGLPADHPGGDPARVLRVVLATERPRPQTPDHDRQPGAELDVLENGDCSVRERNCCLGAT